MKTVITVENGKITLQIDDQQPVSIAASKTTQPTAEEPIEVCSYCVKRGAPCLRHGGERSGVYTAKKHRDNQPYPATKSPEDCGYCRKRGSPCVRHGGSRYRAYFPKDQHPALIQPLIGRLIPTSSAPASDEFDDRWDCEMCRNAGDFCDMHEKMEADGKSAPSLARPVVKQ